MININEIVSRMLDAIIETGSDRLDEKHGDFSVSVYWAGTVLRVDIKGIR